MGKVIYFSPSEHGVGANKCLKKGCYEDKHTRPIVEVAAKYLKASGFDPYIAEKGTSMAERVAESDELGADLHVPVHTNAASNKLIRYLLFMFFADNAKTRKLFNKVRKPLEKIYPQKKKATFSVRKDLYEINQPKAMTLYCELGFHTNQTDCDDFIHNEEAVGKALAQGICDYYGVKLKDEKKLKKGAKVKIKSGAKDLNTGKKYSAFVYLKTYTVISISGSRVVFGLNGAVTGATNKSNIKLV